MNVVFFNGPSVRQFLNMPRQRLEIGCNFIEQHRAVHHVCAYDQQVIQRLNRQLNPNVQYWTRRSFSDGTWRLVPAEMRVGEFRHHVGFCSGTLALALAHHMGCDHVYLLGCDWQVTNASVFDDRYHWRQHQPNKTSRHKLKFLHTLGDLMRITVVHDEPRELAGVEWMTVNDFRGLL